MQRWLETGPRNQPVVVTTMRTPTECRGPRQEEQMDGGIHDGLLLVLWLFQYRETAFRATSF